MKRRGEAVCGRWAGGGGEAGLSETAAAPCLVPPGAEEGFPGLRRGPGGGRRARGLQPTEGPGGASGHCGVGLWFEVLGCHQNLLSVDAFHVTFSDTKRLLCCCHGLVWWAYLWQCRRLCGEEIVVPQRCCPLVMPVSSGQPKYTNRDKPAVYPSTEAFHHSRRLVSSLAPWSATAELPPALTEPRSGVSRGERG